MLQTSSSVTSIVAMLKTLMLYPQSEARAVQACSHGCRHELPALQASVFCRFGVRSRRRLVVALIRRLPWYSDVFVAACKLCVSGGGLACQCTGRLATWQANSIFAILRCDSLRPYPTQTKITHICKALLRLVLSCSSLQLCVTFA